MQLSDTSLISIKNTITGDEGSPAQPTDTLAPASRLAGIVGGAQRAFRIRDLIPVMPCSTGLIQITRELGYSNEAAPQEGEGTTKAESDLTFELIEAPVRTIAHWLKDHGYNTALLGKAHFEPWLGRP